LANITLTEVNDSLATIIAAEALGRLRSNTVLSRLIARDWDNEVASHGQIVKIPVRGSLSVNDKSANTNYTLQTPADTSVSVTLNKHKEVSFVIEDIAKALARPDFLMGYIDDAVIAIGEQIDADIAALYSGLSQSIDATSTAGPLDYTDFIAARKLLSVAKAPMSERYAVLHPTAAAELLADTKFTNRDYRGPAEESALKTGFLGEFGGFTVIEDQNIVETGSEQKNLFFHKNAFCLVTRPLPAPISGTGVVSKTMDEDGVGLRVQISYQHLLGGHLATVDVLYGVAELRDALGVNVRTD
jgi:hypothetical protein